MVDLVGRATVENLVGTMPVVPDHEEKQLTPEVITPIRDHQLSSALALDRSDQPFDHGDAAVLAHGPESLTDAAATAPFPKASVGKLDALVRDEMPWLGCGSSQGMSEERPDRRGN